MAHPQTDAPSDTPVDRLLGSTQFSVLPDDNGSGDPIARKERVPPLFTDSKDFASSRQSWRSRNYGPASNCAVWASNCAARACKVPDIPSVKSPKVVLRGLPPIESASVKFELEKLGLKAVRSIGNHQQAARISSGRSCYWSISRRAAPP